MTEDNRIVGDAPIIVLHMNVSVAQSEYDETNDTIRDVVVVSTLVCILYCNDRRHTHITHNSELYSPTVRDIQLNLSSSKSWKSNVF